MSPSPSHGSVRIPEGSSFWQLINKPLTISAVPGSIIIFNLPGARVFDRFPPAKSVMFAKNTLTMKTLLHSLLLASSLVVCADEIEVPPDFAARMTRHYGGGDLREAFRNAGVPLEANDKMDFIPSRSKLVFEAGELANNMIRAISSGIPSASSNLDPERVRALLADKTWSLGDATLGGVRLPQRLNFLSDSSAVELNPPHWRTEKPYRWGVNQRGEVELRDQSGALVLTGRISSSYRELWISLPLKPTVIVVPIDYADTAQK